MNRNWLTISCGLATSALFFGLAEVSSGIWQNFLISLSSNVLIAFAVYFVINIYLEKRNWRGSMNVINQELKMLNTMLVSYVDIPILGKNNIQNFFNVNSRLVALRGTNITEKINGFSQDDWKHLSYNVIIIRQKLRDFLSIYSPALTSNRAVYEKLLAVWRSFSKFDDWFGMVFVVIDQKNNPNFPEMVKTLAEDISAYLADVNGLLTSIKND